MARPCSAAQGAPRGTPCVGWNGTSYGNRRTAGARGWDMASPQHFHHGDKEIWGECGVGPDTGFLCGSPVTTDCSCCPCDMYGLPDWNLAVKAVQESHTRHLEELHHMGVTMLRIDAALYMEPELMSSILNRFPWDVVYQEWWHELPLPGRTDVFGLYRDLKFMRVEVVVDVVLNHMARPCSAAQGAPRGTPCVGWNGTSYGNRRTAGARGWDMASPQHFHHGDKEIWGECGVGPDTGFLCGSPVTTDCSCCPCDMYGLPDWNLAVKAVQESHTRHLEELHHMGVTMLRIDAALYMEPELMSSILNRFPWDVVYQEWWHELPLPGRTDVFGLYRDLKFMRRVSEFLAVQDISRTQEVLDVDRGDFYIHPVEAVYPTCFHDGRSDGADPAIPTFKNGLAFHQQQLFLLASPFPVTVVLWGGYAWRSIDDGPPGCEGGQSHCAATSPHSEGCRATPTLSPSPPLEEFTARPWICEHRWQGVAGLLRFRASCRHAETRRWTPGGPEHLRLGHLAFRLGSRCFVALARGRRWRYILWRCFMGFIYIYS
ncbi:unnamed protein product [Cladocopium goreaui]|uniref:Alpha-amylase n=1 Tax=Cladocopium goreaui TaxID=2562237 RepID=A0A9P1DFG4_9DINO|nr:unnamed protein product [Cladocopium goreaui]